MQQLQVANGYHICVNSVHEINGLTLQLCHERQQD